MLLESYEQSKRSPAYKELRAKYKALKQTHHEILAALVSLAQNIVVRDDEPVAPTKQERRELKKARRQAESEERECDSEETIANIISNLAKTSIVKHSGDFASETVEGIRGNPEELCSKEFEAEPVPDEFDEICVEEEEMEELNRVNEVLPTEEELDCGDEEFEEVESDEIEIEVTEEEVEVEEEEVEVEEEEEIEIEVEEEEVEVEEEETEEIEVEEEETEEVEVEEEEEEEAGVYEIERNGKRYFTTNEQDGIVYEAVGEDDVGDEIGKFVKGKLILGNS
jgi:hypothetical protein